MSPARRKFEILFVPRPPSSTWRPERAIFPTTKIIERETVEARSEEEAVEWFELENPRAKVIGVREVTGKV